jgi:hypothetical protein
MRAIIVGVTFGFIAALLPPPPMVTPSKAGDLLSTHKRHYTKGPRRGAYKGFSGSTRSRRTVTVQAQNDRLYVKDPGYIASAAEFDLEASLACREGRLKRLGGGIAEFNKTRYPAAFARQMSRAEGIALSNRLYIFVNESSTACRVYTFG